MSTTAFLGAGHFERSDHNPLEVQAVLVDETSMLDINLGLALLEALPRNKWRTTHLVLVGGRPAAPISHAQCCRLEALPPASRQMLACSE